SASSGQARNVVILGLVTSAAIMSKLSGLFLLIPCLYVLRRNFRAFFLFTVSCLLFIAPWFLVNLNLYNQLVPTYALSVICKQIPLVPIWQMPFKTLFEFRHTFYHFAGFYGWNEVYPPKFVFTVYGLLFITSVIVGIVITLSSSGSPRANARGSKMVKLDSHFHGNDSILYLVSIVSLLGFLGAMFIWNSINGGYCDIQGRYLLPIFVLLIYFQSYLLNRKSLFYFSVLYILYSIFSILIPRYY
ncbi:MAG: hypothetical protein AAB893_00715, partial [Patescibacteria group bacterium]